MLVPAESPSREELELGLYEPDVTQLITERLRAGMTFIDLGAYSGYYTLLASKLVGSTGRVYCFDPDPRIFPILEENLRRNGCLNVIAVNKGGSDSTGAAVLAPGPLERSFLSNEPLKGGALVETVRLDDYFRSQVWPAVDLLKMDVEGSEMEVLRGMTELCQRNPNLGLIIESNPFAMARSQVTFSEVVTKLEELGFSRAKVIEKQMGLVSLAQLPRSKLICNLFVV